jgi:hypothetical protein
LTIEYEAAKREADRAEHYLEAVELRHDIGEIEDGKADLENARAELAKLEAKYGSA